MRKLLLLVLVAGCGDDALHPTDAAIDAAPDSQQQPARADVLSVPASVVGKVDILVMVDDSPSTADKTANLKASFPALISTLDALPGGRPDLHIGVITSDVGTKGMADAQPGPSIGSGQGACIGTGKAGVLQTQGSPLVTGAFLSDVATSSGRATNYTGTLADAFSAIASVGAAGCGFEQPLQALQLALSPATTANEGFLRPEANLVVLLLSDEDDCSVNHSTLFSSDTTVLGPLQSFRCTRFGITCDQGGATSDAMNQVGAKSDCHSNESSAYLTKIADHVGFLKSLKADPRRIMIGALVGDPTPVATELRSPGGSTTPVPALAHSCSYTDTTNQLEVADPAVRIAELANPFQHHIVQSVCTNLGGGLTAIAHELATLQGSTCLTRQIATPASCVAVDRAANGTTTPIAACPSPGQDCFSIDADATACPDLQHLKATINRVTPAADDIVTTVSCVL
ncbi:MAG: hypothetical protein ABJE66_31950 [Deltaproteobacteria bacterium]